MRLRGQGSSQVVLLRINTVHGSHFQNHGRPTHQRLTQSFYRSLRLPRLKPLLRRLLLLKYASLHPSSFLFRAVASSIRSLLLLLPNYIFTCNPLSLRLTRLRCHLGYWHSRPELLLLSQVFSFFHVRPCLGTLSRPFAGHLLDQTKKTRFSIRFTILVLFRKDTSVGRIVVDLLTFSRILLTVSTLRISIACFRT